MVVCLIILCLIHIGILLELKKITTHLQGQQKSVIPVFKPFNKEVKETKEMTDFKAVMDNIDAYDGTGKGQAKV